MAIGEDRVRPGNWMLHPLLLGDSVLRTELQGCIEIYFKDNDTADVTKSTLWDTFKEEIRGHCVAAMANVCRVGRIHREKLEKVLAEIEREYKNQPCSPVLQKVNIRGN